MSAPIPCALCTHIKADHKKRTVARLGDWYRVCVTPTSDTSVCGCFVFDPRPAAVTEPEDQQ